MGLANVIFYLAIVWASNFSVDAEESEQNYVLELQESRPTNGLEDVVLKIDVNPKQETVDSCGLLTNLINIEFELQRREVTVQQAKLRQLLAIVESQKEELKSLKRQLSEQNDFIKQQFIEQSAQNTDIKRDLERLFENINKSLLSQEQFEEKLLKNAIEAVGMPQMDSTRWNTNFNCLKNCGPIEDLPDSCENAMKSNFSKNGVYLLNIPESGLSPFFVYCKRIDGKVWTIIQRREDGSVDFYQNWYNYKNGFGNLYGEFWLGLERLHVMSSKHKHELQVWLEDETDEKAFAHYEEFSIASEAEKYRLFVDGYTGNAGNGLSTIEEKYRSNGTMFSTHDNCNDNHLEGFKECAQLYRGGWWFSRCYMSHLNGPYNSTKKDGVDWNNFKKKLKYTQMGIRRV